MNIIKKSILSFCNIHFFHKILIKTLKSKSNISYDSINIIDFQKDDYWDWKKESTFEKTIISSLKLIKDIDVVLYEKLKKEFNWIVWNNKIAINTDQFIKNDKIFFTTYEDYWDDQKLMTFYYAGILIYNGIFNYLIEIHSNKSEDKLKKIHAVCNKKEKKFYKKIEKKYPKYKDILVKKFIDDFV